MTARGFVALHDAGVAVLDCEHKTPPAMDVGHPYIAIPNLRDGRINLDTTRKISDEALSEWTRRTKPRKHDVVVTRRGRVGDSAPIPSHVDCAIGQNLVILRSDGEQVDQMYLRWATRGKLWFQEVDRLMNVGAVFSSLNVRDIAKLRIPVPPLPEQRAIAATLGALDDKIESNRRAVETAMSLATASYERFAYSAPRERLGDHANLVLGGTPSRKRPELWEDGSIPWIASGAANAEIVMQPTELITQEALDGSAAKMMPKGATVIAITGATLGQVALLGIDASGNQSLVGVWADKPGLTAWLHFALRASMTDLMKSATGAAQQHVNKGNVADLMVPIARERQLDDWGATNVPLISRCIQLEAESQRLAALRDALLPELLSGRIHVSTEVVE